MGESERASAGTTRMRMREILNYRCECELGIRNEMGTFMLESIPKSVLTKVERLKLSDEEKSKNLV